MAVDNYWHLAFSRCELVLICHCTTPAAWLGKAIVHMVLFLPCLDQARQTRQMESHTVCRQSHVMCLPALIGHGLLLLAEMQGLRCGGVSPLYPYLQRCGMQRWLIIRERKREKREEEKGSEHCVTTCPAPVTSDKCNLFLKQAAMFLAGAEISHSQWANQCWQGISKLERWVGRMF